jgi:hypothetical protein
MAITLRGVSETDSGHCHLLARKTIDTIPRNGAHVINLGLSFPPTWKEGTDNMVAYCKFVNAFPHGNNLSRSVGHWNTRHCGGPHPAYHCIIMVVQ